MTSTFRDPRASIDASTGSSRAPGSTRRALLGMAAAGAHGALSACGARRRANVTFGVIAARTGSRGVWGTDLLRGLELAVARANLRGGLFGRAIRLAIVDGQSRDEQAGPLTTRLCEREEAAVVFGELSSASCERGASAAAARSVPFISVGAASRDLSRANEFAFRVAPTDLEHALALAKYTRQTLQKRRVAVLYRRNSLLQLQQADAFAEAVRRGGGDVVLRETFSDVDADVVNLANLTRGANPEVVFVPAQAGDGARIALALRNARVSAQILGTDGWRSETVFAVGAEAVTGTLVTDAFSLNAPRPATEAFVQLFREAHRADPGTFAALAYDAARWVLSVATRVPSLEPRSIRDALAGSQFDDGATGTLTVDARRALTRPIQLLRVERDRFTWVDSLTP
jgi:branched-chain amino acid transport system substrate-binding protein